MASNVTHLIITGSDYSKEEKTKAAYAALQLFPHKYTTRMPKTINSVYLGRYAELPYLKALLIENVDEVPEIVALTKSIELFNENIAIIFTSNKPCLELSKDTRYNIITVEKLN